MADTFTIVCYGFFTLVVLSFAIGIPVAIIFRRGNGSMNPIFSVESTTIKAYNLTSDDRLFCIINIGVKVQNPNPNKYTFKFSEIDMEVRKGVHHKLADDALLSFSVPPGGNTVVDVEAVGLRVGLKKKIATEVRADVAAGEGRVNLYLLGFVGSDDLGVLCKNVVVDFSRLMVRVDQKVECGVSVTSPSSNDD